MISLKLEHLVGKCNIKSVQRSPSSDLDSLIIIEGSVPDVLRDGTEIISIKVDLSQPGTSSVHHHPVDPSELLCGQLGLSQVHFHQARYSRHQDVS